MRPIFLLCLIASPILAEPSITTSVQHGVRKTHESGELIFEDNFDFLDFDKWEHEITMSGGGNWEFQVYWNNRSNSYCTDSKLFIKPLLTSDRFGEEMVRNGGRFDLWGGQPGDLCTSPGFYGCERIANGANIINPVSSARIRTAQSFAFTYGRVEVDAKLPEGDWLWPAIWMLPLKQEYGLWPTSGEIDIMESRGNKNLMKDGVNIGTEQFGSTLHFGVDYIINGMQYAHIEKNDPAGFNTDFHTYSVEWTPEKFTFALDGNSVGEVVVPEGGFWELGQFETDYGEGMVNPWKNYAKNAPFDKDFYLVINMAVGGTIGYFPEDASNAPNPPKPWNDLSETASLEFLNAKEQWYKTWDQEGDDSALQIDSVRVYAL